MRSANMMFHVGFYQFTNQTFATNLRIETFPHSRPTVVFCIFQPKLHRTATKLLADREHYLFFLFLAECADLNSTLPLI